MKQVQRKIMIKINSKTNFTNVIMKILTNSMTITAQDVESSQCRVLHGTQMKLKKIRIQSTTPPSQVNKSPLYYNKIHSLKISFPSIKMRVTSNKKLLSVKLLKKNRFKFSKAKKKVRILMHQRQKKILRKISQISILKQ